MRAETLDPTGAWLGAEGRVGYMGCLLSFCARCFCVSSFMLFGLCAKGLRVVCLPSYRLSFIVYRQQELISKHVFKPQLQCVRVCACVRVCVSIIIRPLLTLCLVARPCNLFSSLPFVSVGKCVYANWRASSEWVTACGKWHV